MLDKKAFYEKHHEELIEHVEALQQYLAGYKDSRQKSLAQTKVEEAYLWCTQMIHIKMRDELEKEDDTKPVDLSLN